jgi:CHAT domain-containing protein/tetratricopeptide (TPR) repeat protein
MLTGFAHVRRRSIAAGFLVTLWATTAHSQPGTGAPPRSPFDDPRLVAWSKAMLAGDREQVIRAVEEDLRSAAPHPYAAYVWVRTQWRLGRLSEAVASIQDARLRRALGSLPEIFRSYAFDQYRALLEAYPVAEASKLSDPWALMNLVWAADNRFRYSEELDYLIALVQRDPEFFYAAWQLRALAMSDTRMFPRVLAAVSPAGALGPTRVGRFVRTALAYGHYDVGQELVAIQDWLRESPNDAVALRLRGDHQLTLEHPDSALRYYASALNAFPFNFRADNYGKALISVGRQAEARREVARYETLLYANETIAAPIVEVQYETALRSAGERGEARRVLERALQRWPAHVMLLSRMASLELESDRPREAVRYARAALDQAPDSIDYVVQLSQALRQAGQPDDARAVLQQAANFPGKTVAYYVETAAVLDALRRPGDAAETMRQAVAEFPNSTWALNNHADYLGKAGKPVDGIRALEAAFSIQVPTEWQVNKLRELFKASGRAERADAYVDSIRRAMPSSWALWNDAASRFRKDSVWREAARANPKRFWPWNNLSSVLANDGRYADAERSTEEAVLALDGASPGDRREAVLDQVWAAATRLEKEGAADDAYPKRMLELLDQYMALGGEPARYHEHRAVALAALGKKEEAAREQFTAAKLAPDRPGLAFSAVSEYSSELGVGPTMAHYHHVVDRDPYNGDKLRDLIKLHVLWVGGDVTGLMLAREMETRIPNYRGGNDAAAAWGHLGDATKDYEMRYSRASSISPSDRYVGWFDKARHDAQKSRSKVVIDYDSALARIYHPDGQVEGRQDHPISGKPTLMQVDAAWVRAEYDSVGEQLLRVTSSGRNEARLTYDGRGRIDTLFLSEAGGRRRVLNFVYNDSGKPTRITARGIGEISVAYKSDDVTIDTVYSPQGRKVALEVTTAFQQLLDLLGGFRRRDGQLPVLPFSDPRLDTLVSRTEAAIEARDDSRTAASRLSAARAELALAQYLVDHIADRQRHAATARDALDDVFEMARDAPATSGLATAGVQGVGLWHALMRRTRTDGLSGEDWSSWSDRLAWLDRVRVARGASDTTVVSVQRRIDAEPLKLVEAARWYPRSYLSNSGFWRRYALAEIVPREVVASAAPTVGLVRRNHDVVIGGPAGLSVLRHGYWEWLAFDETQSRFSRTMEPGQALGSGSSNVLALAEDTAGTLWIGTANGLVRIAGDYTGEVRRWVTIGEGLPASRVTQLAPRGAGMLVGTASGLRVSDGSTLLPVAGFEQQAILFLRAAVRGAAGNPDTPDRLSTDGEAIEPPTLIGTATALYGWAHAAGAKPVMLDAEPAQQAVWSPEGGRVFLLRERDAKQLVYVVEWDGTHAPQAAVRLPGQQDVVKSTRVNGLGELPISASETGIAVLTDQGISVFHADHFEHVIPPELLATQRAGVVSITSRDRRTYLLTTEGVYAIERGQAAGDDRGEVADILVAEDLGLTFVARGEVLEAVRHDSIAAGAQLFDAIAATRLARDRKGRLIANDGFRIVRYPSGSTSPEALFGAVSSVQGDLATHAIGNILAASDGTIWVAAGSSLFRWTEDMAPGTAEEFSFFLDPRKFPARSEMISRVVETKDHRIWVIASRESHLVFRGQQLQGGVLEWTGTDFRRLDSFIQHYTNAWFLTGYTIIDSTTAIAGSAEGFVRHRGDQLSMFGLELQDPSYGALKAKAPRLHLGTAGARIGKDVWLFGTAGGIVAYDRGRWFYPDRLNWMLPDDSLSQYGSRAVHAIATDSAGHIYAGTDRGLLIYDGGGGNATSFMVSIGDDREYAFGAAEAEKLAKESDILLGSLDSSSALAGQVRRITEAKREVARLEVLAAPSLSLAPASQAESPPEGASSDANAAVGAGKNATLLREQLAEKQRAYKLLLTQLEQDNRALYQMLELKPLELAAVRNQLDSGEVVVQYLPTPRKLYIQMVTRGGTEVREVEVEGDSLQGRALELARQLGSVRARAQTADSTTAGDSTAKRRTRTLELFLTNASETPAVENLAWLYDQLLRPIERDIALYKRVLIVPVGALTYVPFAALVRQTKPRVEYAVERFTFGYLPSMYLLDLMLRHKPSPKMGALVMGDPDGSLRGAREEAGVVDSIIGDRIGAFVGERAAYDTLFRYAGESKVVHLATHGRLDGQRPERSSLRLANNRLLRLSDVMMLPLSATDLVVLSACETAIGLEGLEYASLARAFAYAGAPSIVATLWRVDDPASKQLMETFYRNLRGGDDVHVALAKAQRAILAADRERSPSLWAGYIPIGTAAQVWREK